MPRKIYWYKQAFNAALVGSFVYIVGGFYGEKLDRDSRHIVVEINPELTLDDPQSRLSASDWRQIDCLARNGYFEARNQGQDGLQAVNDVVFNRMSSGLFPKDACAVVSQCDPVSGTCQFSWFHDGKSHAIRDKEAWQLSMTVAMNQWIYRGQMHDRTDGATRYHATYVSPKWGKWKQTVQIGLHQFFKPKDPQS